VININTFKQADICYHSGMGVAGIITEARLGDSYTFTVYDTDREKYIYFNVPGRVLELIPEDQHSSIPKDVYEMLLLKNGLN
jgi:hypothetical protein